MTDSVETLGVDLRTRVKNLGAKEKGRRKKCKVRFSLIEKNKVLRKELHEGGVKKLFRAGYAASKNVESACNRDGSCGNDKIKKADGSSSSQAKRVRPPCPCSWKHLAWK